MRDNLFDPRPFGHRTRRGDMAPLILKILLDKPMHGYEIISRLEEKSHGMWRPSAGSIYPNLQMLEEQELVTSKKESGKKVYTLTDKGEVQAKQVEEHLKHRWEDREDHLKSFMPLRKLAMELMDNIRQIVHLGSDEAIEEAKQIVLDANQKLAKIVSDKEDKKD